MTLLFGESFDWTTTAAHLTRKWTSFVYSFDGTTTFVAGRTGNGVKLAGDASARTVYLRKGLGVNLATGIIGASLNVVDLSRRNGLELVDGTTVQVGVYVNSDGSLSVKRGGYTGTVLGTSAISIISTGVNYYVEMKATIHDSTGIVEVKVNGTTVINLTGQDTQQSANAYLNTVGCWGEVTSTHFVIFDDFYFCDTNGSVNNDFLGAVKISALRPTGAGTNTDWTPSAGANYAAVDDASPDDSSTYIQSDTAGHKDTYVFEDLPAGNYEVLAIQHNLMCQSSDRTLRGLVRLSGTDYETGSLTPGASYADSLAIQETSPDTSLPFTSSEIDGAEFGVKVQA